MAPRKTRKKRAKERLPLSLRRRRPPPRTPYCLVGLNAAGEALHSWLYDDFWEFMKEYRKRPEIKAAEEAWQKAIAEYFSPVAIREKERKQRSRRAGRRRRRSKAAAR